LRLYEYQTKSLLSQFDIPVPAGKVATTPEQAAEIAMKLNTYVVIKPQVLSENTTQNTDIKLAQTPQIAHKYALSMLGKYIDGQIIHSVMVETVMPVITKIYLTIINDYELNKPVIIVSEKNIDTTSTSYSENRSDSVIYETIDPFIGFLDYQAREIASSINLSFEHWKSFTRITQNLFRCYVKSDALKVEISPLIITDNNEFLVLDAGMLIDDKALYRQVDLVKMNIQTESEIQQGKMSNTKMKEHITCIVNGSGVALTILDIIALYGNEVIESAKVINVGEEGQTQKVETTLRTVLTDVETKAALINLFGGITSCDTLALSALQVIEATHSQIPIIFRLTGERAHEGRTIIKASQLPNVCTALTLTEAVQKAITL
jgi:succinyl-CoA synthetase beta subunit